jgi:hypothetical protein
MLRSRGTNKGRIDTPSVNSRCVRPLNTPVGQIGHRGVAATGVRATDHRKSGPGIREMGSWGGRRSATRGLMQRLVRRLPKQVTASLSSLTNLANRWASLQRAEWVTGRGLVMTTFKRKPAERSRYRRKRSGVMTSTKISVHKKGSARAMVRQRLHEPMRTANKENARPLVTVELGESRGMTENVAYNLNQCTVWGSGKRCVSQLEMRNYLRAMVEEQKGGWLRAGG